MKTILCALIIGITILTAGCANKQANTRSRDAQVDVVSELTKARKPLFDKLVSPLSKDKPIISASFANIDDLTTSSTFGRMASEVISSGMTARGYRVIEVKMRDSLFIKQRAGEFMLSRNLQNISEEHDAQAVMLGTYAIGGNSLYVNARLVRTIDNIIIGSHDFMLPLNNDLQHLLGIGRTRR
ncbi:hypothetical protein IOQ59_19120 [Pontibacterium sp. N1Y112]|uniref:FlgO domain-containing protein n=1 Tax=Pontibacterium sinense TaxID=2781979 RepID=A0A8J7FHB7_9GAMM|nr:FlgO family outer membrane protein [Pontibacterium sinense]MBE9399379.1 hypothetical protein [Pontibacterium sinense]